MPEKRTGLRPSHDFNRIGPLLSIDASLQQFTLNYLPSINIENNPFVNEQLEQLRGGASALSAAGQMPPFLGITDWINSPPLTPEKLKRKSLSL